MHVISGFAHRHATISLLCHGPAMCGGLVGSASTQANSSSLSLRACVQANMPSSSSSLRRDWLTCHAHLHVALQTIALLSHATLFIAG